jgi:two-component system, NarL family, sensor histidine kinase EvgS
LTLKAGYKVFAAFAGVSLLTALAVLPSLMAFRRIASAAELRKHSYEVLGRAEVFLSALRDAETGQRGYAITGDERFLEPYLAVRGGVTVQLRELRQLTSIASAQKRLDAVVPLADAKLAELALVIDLRRHHDLLAVQEKVSSGLGKRLMDSIRAEMTAFTRLQKSVLREHEAKFQSDMRLMLTTIVTGCLTTLALALMFAYLIHRQTQQRQEARGHRETRRLLTIQDEMNRLLQLANDSLVESEERLAVTLNCIGDAVITTDTEKRVTRLNPVAERLTGWTQAEGLGRSVDEIFRIVSKTTREPVTIPVTETLIRGKIEGLANHTVLIGRDGNECDIADSCAPILDRGNQVVGAVMVFRNVTAEIAAQQALLDHAARFQTVLNTALDGIITLQVRGGIVETANPAAQKMFGYPAAEFIGQELSIMIPAFARNDPDELLGYHGATHDRRALGLEPELIGHRKDGTTFPMEIAVSEMLLAGQRYFTAVMRDVTARRQAEAELEDAKSAAEKANRAKSEFLSNMSHELRSPLNAILGFAQLMESDSPLPTVSQQTSIAQILQAGWHLLNLINEVLDLATIEAGKLLLSTEAISAAEVMSECRTMLLPDAQKRGISMTFPGSHDPLFVSADRTRFKQVVINLVSNAIKYNRKRGTITVACSRSTVDRTRISVTDTGIGLSPEQLAQLFQPFNRLGQQELGDVAGTGIGLVMTQRLVGLMGGVLGVESTAGEGSVFWFELPSSAGPLLGVESTAAEID